jgi:hypothetical protein
MTTTSSPDANDEPQPDADGDSDSDAVKQSLLRPLLRDPAAVGRNAADTQFPAIVCLTRSPRQSTAINRFPSRHRQRRWRQSRPLLAMSTA